MSKREIASLACKILSIYLMILGINVFSNVFSFSMVTQTHMAYEIILNIIYPMIYILFGILLWLLSDKLSLIMVKGESHSNESFDTKASDIQRISFSVLGLFFLGSSLPNLASTIARIHFTSELPNYSTRLLLGAGGPIIQFIVGLGIFLGSQGLVNFLDSIRTAGLKREDDYEEKEW